MTVIYLIRHGENNLLGKRLPGWMPGVHLNARGKAQAEAVAQALAEVPLRAIYASPLERTIETAQPLARLKGMRIVSRPGLGELKPGRWQGQPLKSLRRRKLWPVIQFTPSLARFPEGESFAEAQSRIAAELEELRQRHPKDTIACFSHADMIKLAIAHYLGLPLDLYQRLSILPGSISLLSITDTMIRVLRVNDSSAAERAVAG
jgi:probable phosphomutase (TIGR03848 family)